MMGKQIMLFRKRLISVIVLAGVTLSLGAAVLGINGLTKTRILPVDEAFGLQVLPYVDEVKVQWRIAPGYYLYKERISVSEPGSEAVQLDFPKGIETVDEYFGDVIVFEDQLNISVPNEAISDQGGTVLEVRYQGCAKLGYCYPPQTRVIDLP
jgi:thiol:disulfide interchange protein DsbD